MDPVSYPTLNKMVGMQKVSLSVDSCRSSVPWLNLSPVDSCASRVEDGLVQNASRSAQEVSRGFGHKVAVFLLTWASRTGSGQWRPVRASARSGDQWQGDAGLLFHLHLHRLVFALKDAEVQVKRGHVFWNRLKLDFPAAPPLPAARESGLSLSSCCRSREIRASDSVWEVSFVKVENIMPTEISISVQSALSSTEQLKRGNLEGWELSKWGSWVS